MLAVTFKNNKKRYLAYNEWRKDLFTAISPKDSAIILYMLPWLLSMNRPTVPGYIKDLKEPFHVFKIESDREILRNEGSYKKIFNIKDERLTVRSYRGGNNIEGVYTIGSVGTINQTSRSDCDIWICIDKSAYEDKTLKYLNEKINFIKDWLDARLKIPIYFFLTDVDDIRKCKFGDIEYESSGSAQKNFLKEEFYRTAILIGGKIPFWWVCYDDDQPMNYQLAYDHNQKSEIGETDLIDLGDLQEINISEFYGAALWQFNKSLTHPLKSIVKMLQLKMILETPQEELLCRKFRKIVLNADGKADYPDPGLFTMHAILDYFTENMREDQFEFIKKCFYLRLDLKLMSKNQSVKEEIAADIFKKYKIERKEIYHLNDFEKWPFSEQIQFGSLMVEFLIEIYKEIVKHQKDSTGEIAPQDLTIIGRKISSSLAFKTNKISILHIPTENVKLPTLTFATDGILWHVHSSHDANIPLVSNEDIMFCLSYLVWNGIFDPAETRMQPNQTPMTLQEIINIGKKIRDVFNHYDISSVNFSNLLDEEKITKILVVVNFEDATDKFDIRNICIIYKNNWEEIFVRRFASVVKMRSFFLKAGKTSKHIEMQYYIQRNNQFYEKIVERTKNLIVTMLAGN